MSTFTLAISCLTTSSLHWSWTWRSRFPCNIVLYSIRLCFYHQSHPQLGIVFTLAPSLHSFWSYFSTDLQWHIGILLTWGVSLSVSYHFSFSYCSLGSQGKNTEVVWNSLLQWTIFCPNPPPWPVHLGWPYTVWPYTVCLITCFELYVSNSHCDILSHILSNLSIEKPMRYS